MGVPMPRSLRRSTSSSRRLAAASLSLLIVTLSPSTFGQCLTITSPVIGIGGDVAEFVGLNTSGYSASIDWGDGTGSVGIVTRNIPVLPPPPPKPGGLRHYSFTVFGKHVYSGPLTGNHIAVSFRGAGTSGAASCESDAFDVVTPDSLSNPQLTLTAATPEVPFSGVVATFSDSNTSATSSDFTAWINWGDGQIGQGEVSGSAGAFSISGDHVYVRGTAPDITISVAISEFAWPPPSYSPTLLTVAGPVVVGGPDHVGGSGHNHGHHH